jgi:hypothetical protein
MVFTRIYGLCIGYDLDPRFPYVIKSELPKFFTHLGKYAIPCRNYHYAYLFRVDIFVKVCRRIMQKVIYLSCDLDSRKTASDNHEPEQLFLKNLVLFLVCAL